MATKLTYKVVSYSSEDADYPASQLNTVSPSTRGWQSVRFCTYPQELGFELLDGETQISQLQLLSHQSKISSKVEIFIGAGSSYKTANFTRLGYLSLDSNERSSFSARELKTVYIDNMFGSFVKLIINQPHTNKQNIYNQVGIIAVSLMGHSEHDAAPKGPAKYLPGHKGSAPGTNYNDLSIDLNLDPQTASKLRQLSEAKSRAVDAEDYLTAKRIKQVEQDLKAQGSKLAQLDMAKADAVMAEDYDLAKEIKDESDLLRRQIEEQIMNINIPGVSLAKPAPQAKPQKPKFAAEPEDSHYRGGPSSARRGNDSPPPHTAGNNGINLPFDELPAVGAAAMSYGQYNQESKTGSSKKVTKVEAVHHDAYDDRIGHDDNDDAYYEDDFDHQNNNNNRGHDSHLDRAIKPKSSTYEEPMGGIDDDPNAYRGGAAPVVAVETFPPGQHPLEGVQGCEALPAPEALAKKSREIADANGIVALLGEYRTRCLFSKTFVLREAVQFKVRLMLTDEFGRDASSLNGALNGVVGVIKVGVDDKNQQVLNAAVSVMDELFLLAKSLKIQRAAVTPLFDPVIALLIEKLADGNGRVRDGGKKGLDCISASPHVGPAAVCAHAVRALPPKQKTAWRPIAARLDLLYSLVAEFGLGGSSGLSADTVLGFSKNHGAYQHSTLEVRDAAKKLVVTIQKLAGTPAVQSTLNLLRPKQLEEYNAAFLGEDPISGPNAVANGPGAGASKKVTAGAKGEPPSPARVDKHLQHATHAPGGKVPTSAAKAAAKHDDLRHSHQGNGAKHAHGEDEEGAPDYTSCMFCGVRDKTWTENDLDVHYWKDCPLLISCPSCAQIVEIAGLPEHLLDECDEKDTYVPCETTGLAIKANDFAKWQKGPNCQPAPQNCMYCPLCLASVEDSDEAWLAHLTRGCPRNTRTNGST